MNRLGRPWWLVAVFCIGLVLIAGAVLGPRIGPWSRPSAEELARIAAGRFLDRYMEDDGRVVRRDQGDDTVSEGQAYAMLLTAAIGDEGRFDLAWTWTRTRLQRQDGLLSWRWTNGRVADADSASDADVDAAHALVIAADRFERPEHLEQARRIAASVLEHETIDLPGKGPVLVAGPWARTAPYVVNPSYFAPTAFAALAEVTGDPRWSALRRSSYELVRRLTTGSPSLPPDWAELDEQGNIRPIASPGDRSGEASFGFDAARLMARFATDCTVDGRELARSSGVLLPRTDRVVAKYSLRGRATADFEHPLTYVAAAATGLVAGEVRNADRLTAKAEEVDHRSPTYYGAAWVALGRVTLTTSLLNGCAVSDTIRQQGKTE